jgi:hypothetical protein
MLPCHSKRIFRYLNFIIEKSEAKAACFPSFPSIPIPTSAYYIMPTSFPPSLIKRLNRSAYPIVAVTFFVYFLMHSVTYAF